MKITIVDKIDLNLLPMNAVIPYTYSKSFIHFSTRLNERYGIRIGIDEYLKLSNLPYLQGSETSRTFKNKITAKVGIIKIHGKNVKVVKSVFPPKLLVTALPIKKINNQNR